MHEVLLEVKDLIIELPTDEGWIRPLDGVSFHLSTQEILSLVGESGSGKSLTSLSILGLIPHLSGRIVQGSILFKGKDLLQMSEKQQRQLRGREISLIFQDPLSSLNPFFTVGSQLTEVIYAHEKISSRQALQRAADMLEKVGLPSPVKTLSYYPHQLSGGMRQRVVIAMALICSPSLIIADEPTTALDVTIQAQILELLKELVRETNTSLIMISHDLGVVAGISDRIAVMYSGRIIEEAPAEKLFKYTQHPYTQGLLASVPNMSMSQTQRMLSIGGTPPSPSSRPPKGCFFAPRCPKVMPICSERYPDFSEHHSQHYAACWLEDQKSMKKEISS